ncbi:hybrid sensor histidine kinase/response regulator [Roseinatronobacter monicus]|uniref:histidine kinase n=1 Tax=Roseinatronobacter monicus TaxID=393481 RepID=A0A543KCS1_9RHOB|nr:PAS-domain containing protein [Roseinatronobacter monicus]TQM92859.1 signal transduction histidine kinase [Roseinatronobacter monicus]
MSISEETRIKLMGAGLNMIQQALSIFDKDLRLSVSNRRYQEMFGLPDHLVQPGAEFEQTIRHLVSCGEYGQVDDEAEAVRVRVEAARAFVPHYMERERANGRWISVEGAPLPQGGWVTVYTDITEVKLQERLLQAHSEELSGEVLAHTRRLAQTNRALAASNAALEQAKRELTEMEARTRLTTEMMPAHIAHLDRNLRYTFSNRRLSSVFPGLPQNIVGLTVREVMGAVYDKIGLWLDRALQGENSVHEFTHDESGRRIRLSLTPDQVDDGPINGIYVMSMDVTEETQARATLAQTRKRELAAQLSSGLAHDFGNLLTIILGLQGQLARRAPLPPEIAQIAQSTIAAARRGGVLLERIATISGHREMHPQPTNLAALLDDLQVMARPSLPASIRLNVMLCDELPLLMLDQGALQDSLLNLILNARDALGTSAGEITLSGRRVSDTWLELRVEDTGTGFSDMALDKGLDPFFTTKGGEGSGLGLAMVYDQITLSGGTVRLANRAAGGGEVTLRLPFKPAAPIITTDAPELVLLVEDTVAIRESVREMLCALGHSVIEATSHDEAMGLLDLPGLGLVLSDINLVGAGSGLDLLRACRKQGMTRLHLMTALPKGDPLHREAAKEFPVLAKPFTLHELRAALEIIA